jgi:putative ABC transport system permease protein
MTWWGRLLRRGSLERQLDTELRDHLARQVADYVAGGLSEADARRRAVLDFGGLEQIKEQCRDARGTRLVDECVQDTRYACRTLAKRPGFTAAALLLLALGIGANTAIFSLLETVLFRDVAVSAPEELYFVGHRRGVRTITASNYPLLERLRDRSDLFAGVTAYTMASFKVANGDDVERVPGEYVAANYHSLLGVRFSRGQGFTAADDRPSAQGFVAVISDRYWASAFNRASDIVGRRITVDGRDVTIAGVTTPEFEGFTPGRPSEITLPLAVKVAGEPAYLTMHDTWTSLVMVARLTPRITERQAGAAVDVLFRQYLSEPENKWYSLDSAMLIPAGKGSDELRQRYQSSLAVLMAVVLVVLLIASANFAHLQLARASDRTREMSIRLSIGAGRLRLVRQLVTESLILSAAGGALGLLLGAWGTSTIAALFRTGDNPVVLDVHLNGAVLGFTTLIALVVGLVFGLTPAMAATRLDIVSSLKDIPSAIVSGGRRWSVRRFLVVGQVALCLLLVAAAGLLLRTLGNLQAPDGSFNGRGVVLSSLEARGAELPESRWPQLCTDLLARLGERREIESSACSTSTPVDMTESRRGAMTGSRPVTGGVLANVVTPGFFRTFDVPLLRGRLLTDQDSPAAQRVAVINERMARVGFPDTDPIGRTFHYRAEPTQQITIVGIVRDVRHNPREQASPTVYTPLGQGGEIEDGMTVALRSPASPLVVGDSVRAAIRAIGPEVIAARPRTFDEHMGGLLVRERTLALLSVWFGILALVLASVGLYGVMSQDVTRRRRELGIRLALGADASVLLGELVREAAIVAMTGIAAGALAALALAKLISCLLFDVSPRDPLTLAVAAGVLAVATLVAGYLPARRAAHLDPALVLRNQL